MTTLALANHAAWNRIDVIWQRLAPSISRSGSQAKSHEDARSRQGFVLEMLNRNPDAFENELDVQSMMFAYPCRF